MDGMSPGVNPPAAGVGQRLVEELLEGAFALVEGPPENAFRPRSLRHGCSVLRPLLLSQAWQGQAQYVPRQPGPGQGALPHPANGDVGEHRARVRGEPLRQLALLSGAAGEVGLHGIGMGKVGRWRLRDGRLWLFLRSLRNCELDPQRLKGASYWRCLFARLAHAEGDEEDDKQAQDGP